MSYSEMVIRNFFSAYLHQDWRYEYQSVTEAIIDYCSCGEVTNRKQAINDLQKLIDLSEAGEFTAQDLFGLSCYYQPHNDGLTLPDWLAFVKKTMEHEIDSREKL